MKKAFLFLMNICLAIMPMAAYEIEPHVAEQLVLDVVNGLDIEGSGRYSVSRVLTVNSTGDPTKPLLYIYNASKLSGETGRFVIVAGDSRARQVLAYGDGLLDTDNIPDGLQDMIDLYTAQLEQLVVNPGDQLRLSAHGYANADADTIQPLLTTLWGQHAPYNLLTPEAGNGQHCPTGCASTALSMILHYHAHANMVEPIPAYETRTHHYQLPELEPVEFEWELMRDSYTDEDSCSEEEELAVARLIQYVGHAEKMDYSMDGSGAFSSDISNAISRFGYTHQYLVKSDFEDQPWADMIQTELQNDRPVLYCACSNVNHAFIIDGFDGVSKYHINWGWNGSGNCYCELSACTPANSTSVYDKDHLMFIHIQPATKQITVDQESLDFSEYTGYSQTKTFTVSGLNLNQDVVLEVHDRVGCGSFSVSPSVITPAEAAAGKTIEVSFTPWDNGDPSAVLTLSSDEIPSVNINLQGHGIRATNLISTPSDTIYITDVIMSSGLHRTIKIEFSRRLIFDEMMMTTRSHEDLDMDNLENWLEHSNQDWCCYELSGDSCFSLGAETRSHTYHDVTLQSPFSFSKQINYSFTTLGRHEATLTVTGNNYVARPVVITIIGEAVWAGDYTYGDVNGDGLVDVSDVTALINYVLGKSSAVNEQAADVNDDGIIDVSDVTMLIQYVMNQH